MTTSTIVKPFPDYYMGALKDAREVLFHQGDNIVEHSDGRIFNCHPRITERVYGSEVYDKFGDVWPIRFEISSYDAKYEQFKAVFDNRHPVAMITIRYSVVPKVLQVEPNTVTFEIKAQRLEEAQLIWDSLHYLNDYVMVSKRPA